MPETTTPDTLAYLLLGLAAAATIMVLFLVSLVVRFRSLQQDIKVIEQLKDE